MISDDDRLDLPKGVREPWRTGEGRVVNRGIPDEPGYDIEVLDATGDPVLTVHARNEKEAASLAAFVASAPSLLRLYNNLSDAWDRYRTATEELLREMRKGLKP